MNNHNDPKRKNTSQPETSEINALEVERDDTCEELHVLIDWTNYFDPVVFEKLLPVPLTLVCKVGMNKLTDKVAIMSKFYNVRVDDFRGRTAFMMYLLKDAAPVYAIRKTTKGSRRVNVHLYDLKTSLRVVVGGCRIHATDNLQETKDNLRVLGLYPTHYNRRRFTSLIDVFAELDRHPRLQWLVMRNFEDMPRHTVIDDHLDVDLLVSDYYLVKRILDGDSATGQRYEDGHHRILNHVVIANKKVLFDFRSVGDNYYDTKLQQDMLHTRVRHPNGFYVPCPELHLHSLIYHAIIHKRKISSTYVDVFRHYGLQDAQINKETLRSKLDLFMKTAGYRYVKPEPSVGYFV